MGDQQIRIDLTMPDGRKATGQLTLPGQDPTTVPAGLGVKAAAPLTRVESGSTVRPMEVGANISPDEYQDFFPRFKVPPAFTRVFFPNGKGLAPVKAPAIANLPAGTLPWCSHKDEVPVREVGAYWTKLLDAVKPAPGRVLRWTFRHEGEDYPRDKYMAYWRDLRLMWNDHPAQARIELVNIHTLYPSRWKIGVNWREWMLPGIAHVDGWDCYPPQNFPSYEPPESLFGLPLSASYEFGMPFAIGEWGTNLRAGDSGAKRAAYMTEGLTWLAARGCRAVGLWGSKEELGGQFVDYRPSDKHTLGAWNAGFALNRAQ